MIESERWLAIREAYDREEWPNCIRLCRDALGKISSFSDEYRIKLRLSFALLEMGKDEPASIDEAISICEDLIGRVEPGSNRWGMLQMRLGYAYLEREWGDRRTNLESAVDSLEQAADVLSREADPATWANIAAEIGHALTEIGSIEDGNLDRAKRYFEMALEVFNGAEYEEERQEILAALERLDAK